MRAFICIVLTGLAQRSLAHHGLTHQTIMENTAVVNRLQNSPKV